MLDLFTRSSKSYRTNLLFLGRCWLTRHFVPGVLWFGDLNFRGQAPEINCGASIVLRTARAA